MKKFYKLLLSIIILFFGFQSVNATHISGVDFQYECVGQDSFLVTLNLYRDCSGISAPQNVDVVANGSCGMSLTKTLSLMNGFFGTEVSQLCPTELANSTCNGGSLPGMQRYIYKGVMILDSSCNEWNLSWSLCCRNSTVNLYSLSGISTYIDAKLYANSTVCNNSPNFVNDYIKYVCVNQSVTHSFSAFDVDGDSLVYSFVSPLSTYGVPVLFMNGYSATQPISNITLDSSNGTISFIPTLVGNYVLAIQVCDYEYGTGVLKGCVTRDIEYVVENCSNQPVNVSNITNLQGGAVQTNSYSLDVCLGNSFSFDVVFSDLDILDSLSLSTNLQNVLPGATYSVSGINPLTVSINWTAVNQVHPNNIFYLSAHDDGCPIFNQTSISISINVVQRTYAGLDKTICFNSESVQLAVVGGSQFLWSVLSGSPVDTNVNSLGFNMTCTNCTNPIVSPQTTTTYVVSSDLIGGCLNSDTITINVAPDFTLSIPNDTLICSTDEYLLEIDTDQPSYTYNYKWTPGNSLNIDTIKTPIANPISNEPTLYTVSVTSALGCVKSGSVFIDLSAPFPENMKIVGDTVLCLGEPMDLSLDLGLQIGNVNPLCGLTYQGSLGLQDYGILGDSTNYQNTAGSGDAIYSGMLKSARHNLIFQPVELLNMGMTAGSEFSSIGFFVDSIGLVSVYENFEIKMGCSGQVDLANGNITSSNMTVVVPSYNHNINLGWNTHNFSNSFVWDGQSSIIVEICYNNLTSVPNGNSITSYTPTTFPAWVRYASHSIDICPINTGTSSFAALKRPNTRFGFTVGYDSSLFSYSWLPTTGISNPNLMSQNVTPMTNTNYQLIVSDSFCTDTVEHFISVVNQFNAGFNVDSSYCFNAEPDTLLPLVGGGYFIGSGVDTNGILYPDSMVVGMNQITYHIDSPVSCANDSSINVMVIALPDASFGYEEVCVGGAPITLNATNPGGKWSGTAITDTINGVFDPLGLSAGTYNISYSLNTPCYNSDTVGIKVIEPYNFLFNQYQVNVCQNDTIHLTNNYTLSNNPLQGSGPTKAYWSDANGYIDSNGVFDAHGAIPGDYIVTLSLTGMDGICGTSKTMLVRLIPTDYPQFPNGLSFCNIENVAYISIIPSLYGNGMSFTQSPISPLNVSDSLIIIQNGSNGKFDATTSPIGSWEFEVTYINSSGCIGTVVDTIYVLPPPTNDTVNQSGSVLTADLSGGYTYQWLDCDNNMQPIQGATGQSFIPTVTGNYAVKISAGQCSITSSCYESWPLGVEENTIETGLKLYPNPTNDILYIDKGQNEELNIEVLDYTGKTIYYSNSNTQITEFKMQDLAAGIYFVKLSNEKGSYVEKVVKR